MANKSQALWVNIDNNIESQFPEYKQKINDISEPYVKLAKDLSLITYNLAVNVKEYAVEKYPVVVQAVSNHKLKFASLTIFIVYRLIPMHQA